MALLVGQVGRKRGDFLPCFLHGKNASLLGRRILHSARRFVFALFSVLQYVEYQSIVKKLKKVFDMRWGREYPTGKGVLCTPAIFA